MPLITRHATKEFAQYKRAKGKNGGEEFEDDGNYGSAAIADVAVLQVISKRIHYGELVPTTMIGVVPLLKKKVACLDHSSETTFARLDPESDFFEIRQVRFRV